MPDIINGGFKIPSDTDPANIVTAFTDFSVTLAAQIDNDGNTRFSGLLDIDDNPPSPLGDSSTNALVVFDTANPFSIDANLPIGWNCAIVHLDATADLARPTMNGGENINWTGDLPPFVIASIVKVSDTQFVSTFGGI